jgi:hypothetical protein
MAELKRHIKQDTFNPVKEDLSGANAKRAIWSSRSLDLALEGLKQGRKLVANPFYENNTKLLKGDLVFDRTQDEIQEWLRCKNDIIYFVEKYCKLMTPEGIRNVKLRDYQENYLRHLMDHRLSIYLACRQCGKTTTSAVFMLHYILFNVDKNALVLGNKRKTAVEILDKAKKIYLELPYFLKPGIYKWNEGEIVLDNGCRLMAEATTINSGISFTFHCVLADEFAHIQPNILDKFYNNLFPTITAAKARFMITSTQNGYNLFCRLYKAAEAGENEYAHFKTDWNEVPEWDPDKRCWVKRDEAWHRLQVANYGSEEAFNAQFGTNFDVSANTLISQKTISKRNTRLVEFVEKDMPGVPYSDSWRWHPDFDPMDCRNTYIVLTTDIAEGGGGDSTVCAVHRFVEPGTNKLECVGYFKSNTLARELATLSIQVFVSNLCHQDRTLLSFERNVYGEIFVKQMLENTAKNVPGCRNFDESIFVKYYNESGTKYNYGIKITSGNKSTHCMLYKEDYEKDLLINDALQYMIELNNFSDVGNGKFAAAFGHDDMVMAEVQLTFVRETLQYKLLKDEFEAGADINMPDTIYNAFAAFDPYADYHEVMSANNVSQMDMYSIYDIDINNAYRRLNNN